MRCQSKVVQMVVMEMMPPNEGKAIPTQPETKAKPNRLTVVREPNSWRITGQGRQGGPAAIIVGVSPGNPGGTPNCVRRPAPAQAVMLEPAPIMEWRPAPGIIREPVPTVISINPMAAIEVRPPTWVNHHRGRLPATPISLHVRPGPVRRQRVIKICVTRILYGLRRISLGGRIPLRRHLRWYGSRCGCRRREADRGGRGSF